MMFVLVSIIITTRRVVGGSKKHSALDFISFNKVIITMMIVPMVKMIILALLSALSLSPIIQAFTTWYKTLLHWILTAWLPESLGY